MQTMQLQSIPQAPTGDNQPTMSSREIAELTDKQHKNVMADIRKMTTSILIVDIETTGLPDDEQAEIIEFGAYGLSLDGSQLKPIQFLIKPRNSIAPQLSAVHHITNEDVEDMPPLSECASLFFACNPNYIVAHNAAFERHFLQQFAPKTARWICTYKCAVTLWPDAPDHSNQTLRYWLGLSVDKQTAQPPHRALPDAYVTSHIFMELNKHYAIDTMANISEKPLLLPKINFGKHRGSKFADAPKDYLQWLSRQDMDEDIIHTAKYWLER